MFGLCLEACVGFCNIDKW